LYCIKLGRIAPPKPAFDGHVSGIAIKSNDTIPEARSYNVRQDCNISFQLERNNKSKSIRETLIIINPLRGFDGFVAPFFYNNSTSTRFLIIKHRRCLIIVVVMVILPNT